MKLALVLPTNYFKLYYTLAPRAMGLAHWVIGDPHKYGQDLAAYSDSEGYLLLDNGAHDLPNKVSLDAESLYRTYLGVRPRVLFLPDSVGDPEETLSLTSLFLEKLQGRPVSCAGVLQGKTESSILYLASRIKEVCSKYGGDLVMWGLPYEYGDGKPKARIEVAKSLYEHTGLKSHLLGLSRYGDLSEYLQAGPEVESLDTGYPINCALHNIELRRDMSSMSKTLGLLPREGTWVPPLPTVDSLIRQNVSLLLEYIK